VQGLIIVFIALGAAALGAAGFFALAFSIAEAVLTALVFGLIGYSIYERTRRLRAESRLERGIEDLSRLLSTDAQAGGVLSQRINSLVEQNAGSRLDGLEADISVLGTVVRQVAEAVAEIEESRSKAPPVQPASAAAPVAVAVPAPAAVEPPKPVLAPEKLKQAVTENKLLFQVEPIVTLPQRRTHGYDLVPRLKLSEAETLDAPAFMPQRGSDALVRHIDGLALQEGLALARRSKAAGQAVKLYVQLSQPTLADALSVDQLTVLLEANRPLLTGLSLRLDGAAWEALQPPERSALGAIAKKGIGLSLVNPPSLRVDFAELAAAGVQSVRVDASRFIDEPASLTDFHTSDIAAYMRRFNIELIANNLRSEQQILSLLDDGVGLVQGPHIGGPAPLRLEVAGLRPAEPAARRAER